MQYLLRDSEDVENFEPFASRKAAKKAGLPASENGGDASERTSNTTKPYKPGTFGAFATARDSVKNGANGFHFDDGFFHQPPSAVVLNSMVLPKVGGDTIFADMGAAFRGLPEALQARAKGLTQTMDWRHAFPIWEEEAKRRAETENDNALEQHVEQLKRDYPPSLQPLVRQHPVTKELSIFANLGFTHHVNDVSPDESQQLVATLCRMAERPEYQVRMRWADEGDVCIYDNRITNHYAVADYGAVGPRTLHHIALLGEPTENAQGEVIG
jgi:taurine dioxygenase